MINNFQSFVLKRFQNGSRSLTGLRQTWKAWKKQCFLWHSGKTWKTQGILSKYFKFLENSGNSVEIDFLVNLLYFLATIYFKWHYIFVVHFVYYSYSWILLFTYLFGLGDWLLFEMTYSGCVFWDAVIYLMHSFYNILYRLFLFFYFS